MALQARLLPILLVGLLASTARAQDSAGHLAIPKNEGWVTDKAGLLSVDQRRELETLMESYKQGTTHEIAQIRFLPRHYVQHLRQFLITRN